MSCLKSRLPLAKINSIAIMKTQIISEPIHASSGWVLSVKQKKKVFNSCDEQSNDYP